MARIRTIKPDFCTSTDVGFLSRDARLFFLQLLTECDDEGRMLWIPRRLAGVLYPHDHDVTPTVIEEWAEQCAERGMLEVYDAPEGRALQVTNWTKHQKISHPTKSKVGKAPVLVRKISVEVPESLRPEGEQGKEGERIEAIVETEPTVSTPECPHELIVAAYHAELPMLRQVREWSPQRQAYLRSRWREKPDRQTVQWWIDLFRYIRGKCPFLIGQKKAEFQVDLEWIVRPTNFLKIIEGKYEEGARAT